MINASISGVCIYYRIKGTAFEVGILLYFIMIDLVLYVKKNPSLFVAFTWDMKSFSFLLCEEFCTRL